MKKQILEDFVITFLNFVHPISHCGALRNMWTIPENFKILAVILYENLIDRETKIKFDENSTFSSFGFSTENVKASKWFELWK